MFAGTVSLSNTDASTSSTTGALQVAGGIYATKASIFAGTVSLSNTDASTSSTTGALQVAGGIYVTKASIFADTAASTGSTSGALQVAGGIYVGKASVFAGTVVIGSGEGTASVAGNTLRAPSAGGTANVAGASLTIAGGASTGGAAGGSIIFQTAPVGTAGEATANTLLERMRILSNGSVGIGTTTPATTLEIAGTGFAGLQMKRRTDTPELSTGLYFDSVAAAGTITLSGTTLTVVTTTAGAWAVGQVISGPSITSTVIITALIPITGGTGGNGTYTVTNIPGQTISGTAVAATGINLNGNNYTIRASAGGLDFLNSSAVNVGGGTSKVYFSSAGNVGIGTTSPTARLEVQASTGNSWRLGTTLSATQSATNYWGGMGGGMNASNNIYSVYFRDNTDVYWNQGWIEGQVLSFRTPDYKTATPVSAGNFVTGQYYEIAVVGTTNWPAIGATASNVGTRFTASGAGSGNGTAYDLRKGDAVHRMTIDPSGNVGIGTTSPESLLSVRKDTAGGRGGEISIVNGATATIGNDASLNFSLESSTYSGDLANAQIKAIMTNTNGAADLVHTLWSGSTFLERMRITAAGNVGIGTTDPKSTFHVVGTVAGAVAPKVFLPAQAFNLPPSNAPSFYQRDTGTTKYELQYSGSADQNAHTTVVVPSSYSGGSITIKFYWYTALANQSVTWQILAASTGDGGDPNPNTSSLGDIASTTNSAAKLKLQTFSWISSNSVSLPSAGQILYLSLKRVGSTNTEIFNFHSMIVEF